jgi:hypothetical protein
VFFRAAKHTVAATWCYQRCLDLSPDKAGAWSNLGNALCDQHRTTEALECHRRAVELAPRDWRHHHNLAVSLSRGARHAEAMTVYRVAAQLSPDNPHIAWDQARAQLHLGDYASGWDGYEARLRTGDLPKRDLPGEKWTGHNYEGRKLLLASEQGFGDTIWAARYFERVKSLGGELIVECRQDLVSLIRGMKGVDRVVVKGEALPEADLHRYICSVPGLFTHRITEIPAQSYVTAPTDRKAKFVQAFDRAAGKLKIGIVWSGSTTFKANRERAVPLRLFLQSFLLPGVQLYSLQKGPPTRELKALGDSVPVIDLAPLLEDFADTAAAIAELDLVIMTDSAVAHLAGAMGKPVWLLLGYVPHWLWLTEGATSPWYPSLGLFRSKTWDSWTDVFDRAGAALMALLRSKMEHAALEPRQ